MVNFSKNKFRSLLEILFGVGMVMGVIYWLHSIFTAAPLVAFRMPIN